MRILFFGDSITQGFWDTEGGWVARIRKHYDSISIKDLDNNIQPEVFNLGISGNTTRELLARIEVETAARKYKNNSLTVAIAIGSNDSLIENGKQWVSPEEFKENLSKSIELIQPYTQSIILVGLPACDETKTNPVPWGDFRYLNRELRRHEETTADVAAKYNLHFVPIFDEFKKHLEAGDEILLDGLHPNDAGHELVAQKMLSMLSSIINK